MISGVVTVTTTPTLICHMGAEGYGVLVQNTGSTAVVLGGPKVTATGATGGPSLPASMTTPLSVPGSAGSNESLYGIVATGSSTVAYLRPT